MYSKVETIRIVQRPNDPKRKSNGGTKETARQEILRSEKEATAGNKFVSGRQQQQQVRVQAACSEHQVRVQAAGSEHQVRVQADSQKSGDASAGQSTACRLLEHHTALSEYLLNPCPTCTLT